MQKRFDNLFLAPVWGRGFRPFFFLGACFGILNICLWGLFFGGRDLLPPELAFDPVSWHAHEMIYGFTLAVVAGFLLTAVANWTGGAPARQMHLAGLCALWLAGRAVGMTDFGLPVWLSGAIETAFVPALAVSLAFPLLRSWNKRNFIFLGVLSVLFMCDVWFWRTGNMNALYTALMMILMMVSLIGGRIIPAFTVAALRQKGMPAFQTAQPKMDVAAIASLAGVAACLALSQDGILLGGLAAFSAGVHALRMRHYHVIAALREPLLWILHAGYGWLVVGLLLLSLSGFGLLERHMTVHALTVGCIGSMTLGMMCRVTLGHTGRALTIGRVTVLSFFMLQAAAVLRVFGPIVMPAGMVPWVVSAAALWCACYAAYLLTYGKYLFTRRPDGLEAR